MLVAQSCLMLCNPMDYNLTGFSVHGIFQARILEWVANSFHKGSSQPRDRTHVSHIAGRLSKTGAACPKKPIWEQQQHFTEDVSFSHSLLFSLLDKAVWFVGS